MTKESFIRGGIITNTVKKLLMLKHGVMMECDKNNIEDDIRFSLSNIINNEISTLTKEFEEL